MNKDHASMWLVAGGCVLIFAISFAKNGYWIFPDPEKSLSNSARDGSSSQLYQQEGEPQQRPDTEPSTFHGYDCTVDCSGHKAGHDWAEEHEITDGDDCDSAGEHYNSPSFAEGCHAYVDGDSASPSDDDSDNQTPDYDQDAEP